MSDGMSEYWKNKRAFEEQQKMLESRQVQTHVMGEDIFEVVDVRNTKGETITWMLRFKSGGKFLDGQFKTKETAEWEADRWVRMNPNHRIVHDAFFEKEVLTPEDVSKTGQPFSTSIQTSTDTTQSSNTTDSASTDSNPVSGKSTQNP